MRGDLVELVQLLVLVVEVLSAEDHDKHLWEAISTISCDDVLLDILLDLLHVCLIFKLDPVRFFNNDVELLTCLDQALVDVVCEAIIISTRASLVHEDPFILTQCDSLLNW